MKEFIMNFDPVFLAFLAGMITWGMTAIGSSFVFLTRQPNRKLLDSMFGFAAGVMIAASYWSLLAPAIEISAGKAIPKWFPPAIGFILGSFFILAFDKIIPHLHSGFPMEEKEGVKTNLQRNILFIFAVTLHNIPEGMAIGVAFGSILSGGSSFRTAVILALGIGIQNIAEGSAVAMPLRCEGMTCRRSFHYGQLSAVVEPISAFFAALAVTSFQHIMPYALSFAAGAMIYVVVEEVIPESQKSGNTDLATISTLAGFVLMMILDVAFT
jgi:zinc transporter, ZIP family